ncbi:MAG: hypothetical protein HRU20_18400 [Pseudomonadales bacterium]|nr:hypothetical protein [Pseudomonadales bacterium]
MRHLIFIPFMILSACGGSNENSDSSSSDKPQVNTLTRIDSYDTTGDGKFNEIRYYTYNNQGQLIKHQWDDNADGNINSLITYYHTDLTYEEHVDHGNDGVIDTKYKHVYDERGNWLVDSQVENLDGEPDYIIISTYDDNDNELSTTYYRDGDDISDRIITYTYNEKGDYLSYHYDNNGDGSPESSTTIIRDEEGNTLQSTTYSKSEQATEFEVVTFDFYSANGNLERTEIDNDNDGNIDQIYISTYDSNNKFLSKAGYDGANQQLNFLQSYTYDMNGRKTVYSIDDDGDGILDSITRYTYNDAGRLTNESTDSDNDGKADKVTSNTYDLNNNRVIQSYDYDGDGVPESYRESTYDQNNRVILMLSYYMPERIIASRTTYKYNQLGLMTQRTYDSSDDGMNVWIDIWAYDQDGNGIGSSTDYNGDGIYEGRDTYSYLTRTFEGNLSILDQINLPTVTYWVN